jgi:23S rRNA (adenine-N6)-dimethyltransferase
VAVRGAHPAPRRPRSQHFLRSSAVAAQLVRLARVSRDDLVLEIGAGDGAITRELGRRAGYVVAVELDPALVPRLQARVGPEAPVLVVEGDAFRQPLPRRPFKVVSNVPFDSTTQLLRLLLDDPRTPLERAALIVQWDVARKRTRSRPSTLLGLSWAPWWKLVLVRRLDADAFRPPPSVDAGVVSVVKRHEPLLPATDASAFRAALRAAFSAGMRRICSPRELRRLGVAPRSAARDLDAAEWVRLFELLRARGRV